MGFGTELLLVLLLGFLILGPKQMHSLLGRVARLKTEFDKATRSFKSHLTLELDPAPPELNSTQDSAKGIPS
jgi:Sec-independent protein translocase protein TatA